MRKLTIEDIDWKLIIHDESIPIRGNYIVSGDDEIDRQAENEIIEKLESGDIWAWCCVEVKGTFCKISESEFLGGCSYKNEEDFKKDYYESMQKYVLVRLQKVINDIQERLC